MKNNINKVFILNNKEIIVKKNNYLFKNKLIKIFVKK
jgi:hypothetical protein